MFTDVSKQAHCSVTPHPCCLAASAPLPPPTHTHYTHLVKHEAGPVEAGRNLPAPAVELCQVEVSHLWFRLTGGRMARVLVVSHHHVAWASEAWQRHRGNQAAPAPLDSHRASTAAVHAGVRTQGWSCRAEPCSGQGRQHNPGFSFWGGLSTEG